MTTSRRRTFDPWPWWWTFIRTSFIETVSCKGDSQAMTWARLESTAEFETLKCHTRWELCILVVHELQELSHESSTFGHCHHQSHQVCRLHQPLTAPPQTLSHRSWCRHVSKSPPTWRKQLGCEKEKQFPCSSSLCWIDVVDTPGNFDCNLIAVQIAVLNTKNHRWHWDNSKKIQKPIPDVFTNQRGRSIQILRAFRTQIWNCNR